MDLHPAWIFATWAALPLCALADWKLRPSPSGRMLLWVLGAAAAAWTTAHLVRIQIAALAGWNCL